MFKANDGDAIPVIRRVGGLEVHAGIQCGRQSVIRRVGGLEVLRRIPTYGPLVIRRVGGLEDTVT